MKRRLFISQFSTGLLLPFLPGSLLAGPVDATANPQKTATVLHNKLTRLMRSRHIGTPQKITITHVYNPERTSLQTLQKINQQDIALVNDALGLEWMVDGQQLSEAMSSARFGSYSVQFRQGATQVVWQCLTRFGAKPTDPTSNLCVLGSQGVLKTSMDGSSYQITNFQGHIVQANSLTLIV